MQCGQIVEPQHLLFQEAHLQPFLYFLSNQPQIETIIINSNIDKDFPYISKFDIMIVKFI